MKKLIELLKQFDIKNGRQYPEYKIEKGIVYKVYHNPFEGDEYIDWTLNIISKQFGFIGRLIDNDKIDREKYYEQEYKPFFWNIRTGNFCGFWIEHGLLMLLAISENPISDLISYLK